MSEREDFATRFGRLIDILHKLRAAHGRTATSLAQDYGKARRTINRDIALLQAHHFPIEELGRNRGYRLRSNAPLFDQVITAEELLPMLLGAQLLGGERAALGKLRNYVVNGAERRLTDGLADHIRPVDKARQGWEWLEPLSQAIVDRTCIQIHYRSLDDAEPRLRTLEPATLFLHAGLWYLDAYDLSSRQHKNYRLSRIDRLERLAQPARSRRRSSDDPVFRPWDQGEETITAVLEVTSQLARWLEENPPHPSQQRSDLRFAYQVRNREAFLRWVLGLSGARLVGPDSFLKDLRRLLEELARLYEPAAP